MGYIVFYIVISRQVYILQNICDMYYRKLHSEGIGAEKNATSVLSADDEEPLWQTGVINITTTQGLLNAVFLQWQNFRL